MGAHSLPSNHTVDCNVFRDISTTLEERGYLKEMILTYKHMFAEQMTQLKFNQSTDNTKRHQYRQRQQQIADSLLEKIRKSESN